MSISHRRFGSDKQQQVDYWQDIIGHYRSSGLSQKQFCSREGIRFGSFKTWLYRLKAGDKEGIKENDQDIPLFTPVVVEEMPHSAASESPSEPPLILELCGDMRIVVAPGFGAETLRRLIHVVQGIHV